MEIFCLLMTIELKHSMFIHIPKAGGRWISTQITKHVKNYRFIGSPIYNAHDTPDTDLPVIAFVRHPVTLLNSLWHHRSRKHGNKRAKEWNWDTHILLERECGCPSYNEFFRKVSERPGIVEDYFNHFTSKYANVHYGRMEYIADDLIKILTELGEDFDAGGIKNNENKKIGISAKELTCSQEICDKIVNNEKLFCEKFGYEGLILNA